MTETPPAPGLTRTNTGVLHGVYVGWYVTVEEQRNIERRASKHAGLLTDEGIGPGVPRLVVIRPATAGKAGKR